MDYRVGMLLCERSALAHARTAYELRDRPQAPGDTELAGFAVAHAALAEEEASKSAFCALVAKGFVRPEDIEPVFQEHPPKSYLFHALVRKRIIEVEAGAMRVVRINRQPMDKRTLQAIRRLRIPEVREHDRDRNAGFYAGHAAGRWQSPGDGCSDDPRSLVYRYVHRAEALLLFAEALMGVSDHATLVAHFKVEEDTSGWVCRYDEI